jgi:hypothetical protein
LDGDFLVAWNEGDAEPGITTNYDESEKRRHSRENGNPEKLQLTKKTGFLLEFAPYLIRGRNDRK